MQLTHRRQSPLLLLLLIGVAVIAAVDTASRRAAVINSGWPAVDLLPVPDGTIGTEDRAHVAGEYGGIAAGEPAPWDLTGIPVGWYSIANTVKDADFRALMVQECDGDANWARWNAGTSTTPRGSANCELQESVLINEANGAAAWARWAPGTNNPIPDNIQINIRQALTAEFN